MMEEDNLEEEQNDKEQSDLHSDAASFISDSNTRQGRWVCPNEGCDMVFNRPGRLRIHMRTHTGERPYVCPCGKSYARNQHLARHMLTHEEPLGKTDMATYSCTEEGCEQSFSSRDNMKKHVRHQHADRYKCKEEGCGKVFRKVHQLRAHTYEHLGVLPFQCHYEGCLRRFTQKSHLTRHFKQHEGYVCPKDECDRRFDKWSDVRKHLQTDHSSKQCHLCGKSFASPSHLNQHMKTHTGEERVKCPVEGCHKSYSQKRNLNAHIRRNHQGQTFSCQRCGQHLATKQKLQEHIHAVHENKKEKKHYPNKGHRKKSIASKVTDFVLQSAVEIYSEPQSQRQEDNRGQHQPPELSLVVTNSKQGKRELVDMLKGETRKKVKFKGRAMATDITENVVEEDNSEEKRMEIEEIVFREENETDNDDEEVPTSNEDQCLEFEFIFNNVEENDDTQSLVGGDLFKEENEISKKDDISEKDGCELNERIDNGKEKEGGSIELLDNTCDDNAETQVDNNGICELVEIHTEKIVQNLVPSRDTKNDIEEVSNIVNEGAKHFERLKNVIYETDSLEGGKGMKERNERRNILSSPEILRKGQ